MVTANAFTNPVWGRCGPVQRSIKFPHLYALVLAWSGILFVINYLLKGLLPNNSRLKLIDNIITILPLLTLFFRTLAWQLLSLRQLFQFSHSHFESLWSLPCSSHKRIHRRWLAQYTSEIQIPPRGLIQVYGLKSARILPFLFDPQSWSIPIGNLLQEDE